MSLGVVIVGHGSREPAANAELEALVAAWTASRPGRDVTIGYVELAQPPLATALADAGARHERVVALPLFLFAAGHVKNDLPLALETARAQQPRTTFGAARALGVHPLLAELVWERALAATPELADPAVAAKTALVVVGRGASDPDANGDFAKLVRLAGEGRGLFACEPTFIGITRPLVDDTLERGPLTVLTNGILVDGDAATRARRAFDRARYSFDLRVSLDGMSAEENDAVRGKGTFAAITDGIRALAEVGLSPALTVVEHRAGMAAQAARSAFLDFARSLGLLHSRVKFLPLLRIGREERRTHGYSDDDTASIAGLTDLPLAPEVIDALVCSSSRLVTAHGVATCPILLDAPDAQLGQTLGETLHPIRLRWAACKTCVVEGLTCRT